MGRSATSNADATAFPNVALAGIPDEPPLRAFAAAKLRFGASRVLSDTLAEFVESVANMKAPI